MFHRRFELHPFQPEGLPRPVPNCGNVGEDGCCAHPEAATPECHDACCPILLPAVNRTLRALNGAAGGHQSGGSWSRRAVAAPGMAYLKRHYVEAK